MSERCVCACFVFPREILITFIKLDTLGNTVTTKNKESFNAVSVKCNDKVVTTTTTKRNIQHHHKKIAHTILCAQQLLQIKMLLSLNVIINHVSCSVFLNNFFVYLLLAKNSSFWHKFYRDRKWIYVSFSNQDHCPNWPSSHIWIPCRKSRNSKVWIIYMSLPQDK